MDHWRHIYCRIFVLVSVILITLYLFCDFKYSTEIFYSKRHSNVSNADLYDCKYNNGLTIQKIGQLTQIVNVSIKDLDHSNSNSKRWNFDEPKIILDWTGFFGTKMEKL